MQLLLDVAVVDVEGHGARLVGAQHALDVLVAVVEVQREVVLPRLPRRQRVALALAAEPGVDQQVGQPPRAHLQVAPGEAAARGDDRLALGNDGGDRLVDLGQRKRHLTPPRIGPLSSKTWSYRNFSRRDAEPQSKNRPITVRENRSQLPTRSDLEGKGLKRFLPALRLCVSARELFSNQGQVLSFAEREANHQARCYRPQTQVTSSTSATVANRRSVLAKTASTYSSGVPVTAWRGMTTW